MVEVNGLKFETSIGVLFALKEARGHKTLQETCAAAANSNIDNVLDVLHKCYEKGQESSCSLEDFLSATEKAGLGLVKLTSVFSDVLEKMMYSGLSETEVEDAKKLAMERLKR